MSDLQLKNASNVSVPSASSYGLLYITRAYNRGEISFDEWLKQSREWAERIISQQQERATSAALSSLSV